MKNYKFNETALFMLLVIAFNLLGDGLRDHLDPRLRGEVRE